MLEHSGQDSMQDRNTQACLGALQAIYANDEAQFEDKVDREGNGGTGCHHDASCVAAPTGLSRRKLTVLLSAMRIGSGSLHDTRQSAGRPTFNASAPKTEGPF